MVVIDLMGESLAPYVGIKSNADGGARHSRYCGGKSVPLFCVDNQTASSLIGQPTSGSDSSTVAHECYEGSKITLLDPGSRRIP